jgi:peptidoglycan/LPS O-acetylase OafA/YrhL
MLTPGRIPAPARIPALDGWRAVAIALVIVSHGILLREPADRLGRAAGYFAGHLGGTGVALFFAISGFLITTLLLEEKDRTGRISLRGFYLRRAFRILPPAYLYLACLAALDSAGWLVEKLHRGEIASAVFLFNNYWPDRSWYTSHFWSLAMEEHFYLFWPAALAALGVKRALAGAGILIAATFLWRPWGLALGSLSVPALQRTDMRLDAFLFACVLAILLRSRWRAPLLRVLRAGWFRWPAVALLAASWAWALLGSAAAVKTLVESALLPPLLASVMLRPESAVHRCLELGPLRWIGRVSYGLYLWQQMFLHRGVSPEPQSILVVLPIRGAAIFLVATASFYLLEQPLLAFSRRWARGNTAFGGPANAADRLKVPVPEGFEIVLGSRSERAVTRGAIPDS